MISFKPQAEADIQTLLVDEGKDVLPDVRRRSKNDGPDLKINASVPFRDFAGARLAGWRRTRGPARTGSPSPACGRDTALDLIRAAPKGRSEDDHV